MQRLCCAVCREVNEFGKLFDREATEVQVVLKAIKVQENDYVSWYNTIHHVPMISNPIHGNAIPAGC